MDIFSSLPSSLPGFRDRFWYWNGASGRKYIHSIYSLSDCPPLPGAVYVTVQKTADGGRKPLEVGRFGDNWDYVEALIADQRCGLVSIDEIHVHLLADSEENADEVLNDLEGTIGHRSVFAGFHEESSALTSEVLSPEVLAPVKLKAVVSGDVKDCWQSELFDFQSYDNAGLNGNVQARALASA